MTSTLLERLEVLFSLFNEGRKDDYLARILKPVGLYPTDIEQVRAKAYLEDAMKHPVLSRRDWLDWLARVMRVNFLTECVERIGKDTDRYAYQTDPERWASYLQTVEARDALVDAYVAKSSGVTDGPTLKHGWLHFNLMILFQQLEHLFSLPIQAIKDHHPLFDSPGEVINRFVYLEREWKEKNKGTLTPERIEAQGATEFLACSGGAVWFLVDKEYCEIEGEAMGHCGNEGNPLPGDKILSLRQKKGDMGHWDVHATFIVNNGVLGEMKGRGNEKPVERYHEAIFELLRDDRIRAIAGGGYRPNNNFSIADLQYDWGSYLAEWKIGAAAFQDHRRVAENDPSALPLLIERLNHYFYRSQSTESFEDLQWGADEVAGHDGGLVIVGEGMSLSTFVSRYLDSYSRSGPSQSLKHDILTYEEGAGYDERRWDMYRADEHDLWPVFKAVMKNRPDLHATLERRMEQDYSEAWSGVFEPGADGKLTHSADLFDFMRDYASDDEAWEALRQSVVDAMRDSDGDSLGRHLFEYFRDLESRTGGRLLLDRDYFSRDMTCYPAATLYTLCEMADDNETPGTLEGHFMGSGFSAYEGFGGGLDEWRERAVELYVEALGGALPLAA